MTETIIEGTIAEILEKESYSYNGNNYESQSVIINQETGYQNTDPVCVKFNPSKCDMTKLSKDDKCKLVVRVKSRLANSQRGAFYNTSVSFVKFLEYKKAQVQEQPPVEQPQVQVQEPVSDDDLPF